MPKVQPKVKLIEIGPGRFMVQANWDRRLHEWFKEEVKPWRGWHGDSRSWIIPTEMVDIVSNKAGELGYKTVVQSPDRYGQVGEPRLRPYQSDDVQMAIERGFRFLSYVTGSGKTPTALCAARFAQAQSILIICPASARCVWEDHISGTVHKESWWPDSPPLCVLRPGKKVTIPPAPRIVIISFEMLHYVVDIDHENGTIAAQKDQWDCIILDEGHMIKNGRSLRATCCQELSEQNPRALRLILTATPATQRPKDIYSQLNWLRPYVQGTFFQFAQQHTNARENGFGWDFEGCRNKGQLADMLRHTVSRVTHDDVAKWMPPVTTQVLRCLKNPVNETVDILQGHAEQAVIFVYRRETAQWLTSMLSYSRPVATIDGSMTAERRNKTINAALEKPGAIIVATMHSAGTGIDSLASVPYFLCPEISNDLGVMRQMIGRGIRMSNTSPKVWHFIVQENSPTEQLADKLARKLEAINTIVKKGENEKILHAALSLPELSDGDLLTRLESELEEFRDESDPYL